VTPGISDRFVAALAIPEAIHKLRGKSGYLDSFSDGPAEPRNPLNLESAWLVAELTVQVDQQ
jgi:hypothetical protein